MATRPPAISTTKGRPWLRDPDGRARFLEQIQRRLPVWPEPALTVFAPPKRIVALASRQHAGGLNRPADADINKFYISEIQINNQIGV